MLLLVLLLVLGLLPGVCSALFSDAGRVLHCLQRGQVCRPYGKLRLLGLTGLLRWYRVEIPRWLNLCRMVLVAC